MAVQDQKNTREIIRLQRRQAAANKRKVLAQKEKERIKEFRKKYYPPAIVIIRVGIALLALRLVFGFVGWTVDSGKLNSDNIIGPITVEVGGLYELDVEKDLSGRNQWCSVTVLLLDSNKNYLTGGTKDLYYEKDGYNEEYRDERLNYTLVIPEEGVYYYKVIPIYSNKLIDKTLRYKLSKKMIGSNYFLIIGFIVLGIGLVWYKLVLFNDEYTSFKPKLDPVYMKRYSIVLIVPIAVYFLIAGLTYQGYGGKSGFDDAPSSWFSNDDTKYFGK